MDGIHAAAVVDRRSRTVVGRIRIRATVAARSRATFRGGETVRVGHDGVPGHVDIAVHKSLGDAIGSQRAGSTGGKSLLLTAPSIDGELVFVDALGQIEGHGPDPVGTFRQRMGIARPVVEGTGHIDLIGCTGVFLTEVHPESDRLGVRNVLIDAHPIDFHLLRKYRGGIRRTRPQSTDRHIQQHMVILSEQPWIGRGDLRAVQFEVDLSIHGPADVIGPPFDRVHVECGGPIRRIDDAAGGHDGTDLAPMGRPMTTSRCIAHDLHDVDFARPRVVFPQHPECGPDALTGRQVNPRLELAVGLAEFVAGHHPGRGVVASGKILL